MLTLFPSPAGKPEKPEPRPVPRRLQVLPLTMLGIAALLNLFAWHRSNVSSAAAPLAKLSATAPSHPATPPAEASRLSSAEIAHESQKAHPAKSRTFQLYTNPGYPISFSYPRSYAFKGPGEVDEEANALLQQRSDGSPNQQFLARIELPDNLYPRTDFLAGYLSLSVNPSLTEDQCSEATGVEKEGEPGTFLLGGVNFHSLHTAASAEGTHSSWREYAAFSSGVCYEIELGVVTVNDGSLTPVNEDRVFHRLDAILRTVKITNPK